MIRINADKGLFKSRVMSIKDRCRATRLNRPEHLRAGHRKPWRDSSNDEPLDGEIGLFLTPSADHHFDRASRGSSPARSRH